VYRDQEIRTCCGSHGDGYAHSNTKITRQIKQSAMSMRKASKCAAWLWNSERVVAAAAAAAATAVETVMVRARLTSRVDRRKGHAVECALDETLAEAAEVDICADWLLWPPRSAVPTTAFPA